jgi:hypothetical protein
MAEFSYQAYTPEGRMTKARAAGTDPVQVRPGAVKHLAEGALIPAQGARQ